MFTGNKNGKLAVVHIVDILISYLYLDAVTTGSASVNISLVMVIVLNIGEFEAIHVA